jgi:hypothetical protein
MIETTLQTLLTTSAPIRAITTSVYPVTLPKGIETPVIWISWKTVTSVSNPTFTTTGITRTRIQIDCWAARYLDAANLRAAVRSVLDGYHDGSIAIQSLSDTDIYDDVLLEYRAILEFYVWHV